MPTNNVRSVITSGGRSLVSRHNFLRSLRRRRKGSYVIEEPSGVAVAAMLLFRGAGLTFGFAFGRLLHGDTVSIAEERRQKEARESFWHSVFGDEVDLREKMWPGLKAKRREIMSWWSGLGDKKPCDCDSGENI